MRAYVNLRALQERRQHAGVDIAPPHADMRIVSSCPECEVDCLVDRGPNGSQQPAPDQWVCFNCGEMYPARSLMQCDHCGILISSDEGEWPSAVIASMRWLSGADPGIPARMAGCWRSANAANGHRADVDGGV